MVVTVDPFGDLVAFDLAAGTRRVLGRDAAGWPEGPVAVADQAFYISGGSAFRPTSPSPLGSADSLLPVSGLQELWATPSAGAGAHVASLFHVQDGWALITQADLNPGETPVAAGPSRLAAVRDGEIVIRDANTGRVTGRAGPVKHSYDIVGASGDTLVYVHNGQCDSGCSLTLFDMTAATATLLPAPAGTSGFIGGGAVSPTGDTAAFVTVGHASGQAELVIDNVDGVRVIPVPFDVEEPVGAAAWDPTGRWIVYGGPRATYLLDTATMRTTLLPFTAGYSFTIIAA